MVEGVRAVLRVPHQAPSSACISPVRPANTRRFFVLCSASHSTLYDEFQSGREQSAGYPDMRRAPGCIRSSFFGVWPRLPLPVADCPLSSLAPRAKWCLNCGINVCFVATLHITHCTIHAIFCQQNQQHTIHNI